MTWSLPTTNLLTPARSDAAPVSTDEINVVQRALAAGGAAVETIEATTGPSVTRYSVTGPKPAKVESALYAVSMATGRTARYVGIAGHGIVLEVPRADRELVGLREVLEAAPSTTDVLSIPLGITSSGTVLAESLARMPHMLFAGATGAGKSEGLNSAIVALVMEHTPDELEFVMIDPKRVELSAFERLPHLVEPIVTDSIEAIAALGRTVSEMERRYGIFEGFGVKSIGEYNSAIEHGNLDATPLAHRVVVVDELADLMMVAKAKVEEHMVRLGQLARACGIHLVLATQSPRRDVVTGKISGNVPARAVFRVATAVDSRIAMDSSGAEKLAGQGDGLWKTSGGAEPIRFQGSFVSRGDIETVVKFWHNQAARRPAPEVAPAPVAAQETDDDRDARLAAMAAPWADLTPAERVYVAPDAVLAGAGITGDVLDAIVAKIAPQLADAVAARIIEQLGGPR